MRTVVLRGLALAFVLHAVSAPAAASATVPVPEIGPASISAGLAILAGGVLMLRARRRSK